VEDDDENIGDNEDSMLGEDSDSERKEDDERLGLELLEDSSQLT
jgi:hypothetical protein